MNYAMQYLKEIEDNKHLEGKSLEAKVAIVMFMASRKTGRPRKMTDIRKYAHTTEKEISQCYKELKKNTSFMLLDTRIQPADIVQEVCGRLKLPEDVRRAAAITAENFSRMSLCEGKKPQTIAGVALFMVTQKMKKRNELDALNEIANAV